MLHPAMRTTAEAYLAAKVHWSRVNDAIVFWAPRAPLRRFAHPAEVWEFLAPRWTYTPDLFRGAGDHYVHHERLQAYLDTGAKAVPWQSFDCDKVGSYAFAALRSIPSCEARMITLLVQPDLTRPLHRSNWGHHTVFGYRFKGQAGVIDTNGHHLLPDLDEETLVRRWSEIYQGLYAYAGAVPTPYPW